MKGEYAGKGNGLLWAARLLPLLIGGWWALQAFSALVTLWSDFEISFFWGHVAYAVFGALPLLIALLAWRYHMLGGIIITISGVALFLLAVSVILAWYPNRFGLFILLIPLLGVWTAGGVCHLLCWRRLRHDG